MNDRNVTIRRNKKLNNDKEGNYQNLDNFCKPNTMGENESIDIQSIISLPMEKKIDFIVSRIVNIEASQTFISEQYETIRQENFLLKTRVSDLETKLRKMELDTKETNLNTALSLQKTQSSHVIINGIPESNNENVKLVIQKIIEKADLTYEITPNDEFFRSGQKNEGGSKIRPIHFKTSNATVTEQLVTFSRKNMPYANLIAPSFPNNRRIYITEYLLPDIYRFWMKVRSTAKDKDYKFVWYKNGSIFIRKTEKDRIIKIQKIEDLQKI